MDSNIPTNGCYDSCLDMFYFLFFCVCRPHAYLITQVHCVAFIATICTISLSFICALSMCAGHPLCRPCMPWQPWLPRLQQIKANGTLCFKPSYDSFIQPAVVKCCERPPYTHKHWRDIFSCQCLVDNWNPESHALIMDHIMWRTQWQLPLNSH